MQLDLEALLPTNKKDIAKAERVVALGYPAVEPILAPLLEWMKDANWPVAMVLRPFLAKIGAPLAPHIKHVLQTDDEWWKYWVLSGIIAKSPELREMFRNDLVRLASSPTPGEKAEEVDVVAREILDDAAK